MQFGCKKLGGNGVGGKAYSNFLPNERGDKLIKEEGLPWEGGLSKELTECIICN